MSSEKSGINEDGINSVCLDIQNYCEKIKNCLESIDDLIDSSSAYYSGDTRSLCLSKKNNLMESNPIIVDNINSYIDDFNTIVKKYSNIDTTVGSEISLNIEK